MLNKEISRVTSITKQKIESYKLALENPVWEDPKGNIIYSGHRDFIFVTLLLHDRYFIFCDEKVVATLTSCCLLLRDTYNSSKAITTAI